MKFLSFLFIGLLLSLQSCATAQSGYGTKNKKAIKLFEEARKAPNQKVDPRTGRPDFKTGIELLHKAIDRDENFLEAHQLLGEFYTYTNNTEKAVVHYKKSLEISPASNLNGMLYFYIGELQLHNGDYEDAKKYFDMVLNKRGAAISPEVESQALSMSKSAAFAIESMKNPSAIDPKNIGPSINTENPEYFPTMTVDGRTFLFTRELPVGGQPRGQEDFFVSRLSDKNIWMKAEPMPPHINTKRNEGAPTLSSDGRTLIFVACADESGNYGAGRQGYGSCDLFVTEKIGSNWSQPKNLPGRVNTANWETQPSLSSDGKTLYFIRRVSRRGAPPRSDIFMSTLQEDGTWGQGVPLPSNINTMQRETSVHIHPDGRTLYFSSNGHIGLGGFDIFMTQKQPDGSWSNPVNLGYPINTRADENSLLVGPDGEIAFFASDRPGGYGDLDIYYFIMPEEYRPTRTTYFEGKVFDAITKAPLAGKFELIDLETGETVVQSSADKVTGEFLVALPTKRKYALNVNYPGYAFFSKNFDMIVRDDLEALHMDVPLIPSGSGGSITLANVFFDLNKSTLREESFVELDKLYNFLKDNPEIKIEIGGHTDTRGDAQSNLTLSHNRAESVYNYLVEKGIDAKRMSYKGYGQTKPIISDEEIAAMNTEKEKELAHQENRRTEYTILKND
jgi:outer membrane protein OmpA-like peptidoglycan-associated protein